METYTCVCVKIYQQFDLIDKGKNIWVLVHRFGRPFITVNLQEPKAAHKFCRQTVVNATRLWWINIRHGAYHAHTHTFTHIQQIYITAGNTWWLKNMRCPFRPGQMRMFQIAFVLGLCLNRNFCRIAIKFEFLCQPEMHCNKRRAAYLLAIKC